MLAPGPSLEALTGYLHTWGTFGQRAAAVLGEIGLLEGQAAAGWPPSRLTMTGAPVELRFANGGAGLRYVTEVGPPGWRPSRRLADVVALVDRWGGTLPASNLAMVSRLQRYGPLTYGAWLGVHHGETEDSFKVYAEVPIAAQDAADAWATSLLGARHGALGPAPRVKMIGLDSRSGAVEMYYGTTDQLRTAVPALACRVGLAAESESILRVVDGLSVFPARAKLPARDVGFSYAVSPDHRVAAFTLLFIAVAMYGDDRRCRDRIVEWCAETSRRLPGYEELLRRLPEATRGVTHHGMVGVTSRRGAVNPILSIGVAAPWPP